MSRAILILSGGRSIRMGQDKATLAYRGKALIDYQCDRFSQAGWQVIAGIPDKRPGFLGPLAGIESGLLSYPDVYQWLIIPVDMPTFPEHMCELLFYEGAKRAAPVAFENAPLPLYLPRSELLLSTLDEWLSQTNKPRSVFALHSFMAGQWLKPSTGQWEIKNYNTPEQWQELLTQSAETHHYRKTQ